MPKAGAEAITSPQSRCAPRPWGWGNVPGVPALRRPRLLCFIVAADAQRVWGAHVRGPDALISSRHARGGGSWVRAAKATADLVEARSNIGGGVGVTATTGMSCILASHSVAKIPPNSR